MLLLSFLALPLIEIATFVKVGQTFGLLPTLLGVVISAIAGVLVIRTQGLSLAQDIRATMGHGQLPARAISDAMMVFFAGVLLLIPGFFTDAVALLLLLPPVRGAVYNFLRSRMVVTPTAGYGPAPGTPYQPRVSPHHPVIDLNKDDYRGQ